MEVHAYSNASNHLPHYKAMEVQESGAAADIPSIKEQIHGMEVEDSDAAKQVPATNVFSQVDFLKDLCETGNVVLDFDSWTSLISDAEKTHADDMERMSLVFDSFLSKFPLYPEYWKRYADHMMRLSTSEKVVEIFERAVESATHSVGLWGDYCSFGMFAFKDPFSIRRLFERALSFVGKDYLCHTLWDMYLKFEFSQQQWSSLAHIIIRCLKFPTKALHDYFDNLKKFASIMEEEMTCHGSCRLELQLEAIPESKLVASEEDIYHVISELQYSTDISLREKALYKYISIGKQFYHKACQLDEKIHCFESCIQRPSFHVKPLDENQLENWHAYLDFVEKQDDFDWAVKLYERCLIVCANYPEFWMRYVELMESKGGREIATFALDRATQIFLKNVPEMHYYTARFREQVGDSDGARAAFFQCSIESNSYFIEKAIKEANMEKRLGNLAGAFDIYEKALKVAVEGQMLHTIPFLCIHFHRLKYLITGSAEAARDILIDGIQHVPHSKSLLEELIKFVMLHEGLRHLDAVDTIIASAISYGPAVSQGLGAKDREELSCLYLEFVDLCGSNNHLRKAWKRHIKLFPHLIRTPFSHKHPTSSSDQLLNLPIDERQSEPLSFPNHPGKGHDQNNLVHLSEKEKELKVSENQAVMSDQFPEKEGDVYEQENMQQISLQVIQSGESEAGIDKQTSSLLHQSGDSVSRSMESSHDLHREDSSGPVDLSIVMLHQSQEPGRSKSTPDFEQPGGAITPLEASEHNSDCVITEQEPDHDCGAGLHVKEVSVDSLSLNTRTNESQDINPTAIEHTGPHEISLPDTHPSSVSPLHSPVSVSGKTEIELEEIQAGGSSSSGSHQKGIQTQTHSQPVVPTSSGAIVESDEHPQQQQQQQQKDFLLEQLATAHIGDKMEVPNSTISHNHSDVASTQGDIMPGANVVHQNSGSASKPVYAHAQTHISQYPMQSNEQLEHIQQTQAYNQMLEYYYQQQQYQHQLLQMQQPYSQQHQQPYNQPQFQQYYLQQQQLQQQQLNLSSFQSQQIQQPQYPLYPNQEQYQQYQMLIQQYQLQQEQGYQQLLQQHQLQGYQQPHQHQQLQQQQQIHDGMQEHQQQITSMQNQTWNVSQGQQGQGIGLLPTPGASETLHNQHQSPQIVSAGGLTRHVLSPHKFQHSPYGGSSDSLRSPSIARQSPQG